MSTSNSSGKSSFLENVRDDSDAKKEKANRRRVIFLFTSVIVAVVLFAVIPAVSPGENTGGLSFAGRAIVSVAGMMVVLWVTEAIPIAVTALLPIAMSVIELVKRELRDSGEEGFADNGGQFNFAICLMLGIAYAASIGGMGTLIGTGTNAFLAAFLKDTYDIEISFVKWMAISVPLVIVFLPIAWLMLTKVVFPIRIRQIPGGRELILKELREQGPVSRGEVMVLVVFIITAAMWITRPLLIEIEVAGVRPLAGLSDSGIAIGAAVILFCLPANLKLGQFVLTWKQAVKLPWGILILFGGGLSLASAIKDTGVAEFIGQSVGNFSNIPVWLLILLVSASVVFVSQLTSNVATTAAFLPIFAAVATGFGINPLLLAIPTTLSASLAFMMPVATPPNAIVFASGEITIAQMWQSRAVA